MTSSFFSSLLPSLTAAPISKPVSPSPTPEKTKSVDTDDDKNLNVVEILEKKIFHLELDRYNLNFGENTSNFTVEEDSMKVKNVETRFRRVSLHESNYNVGWVVDGDVSNCMCCGFFFFLIGKYHCRACGNVVCSDCSPYAANIPCLNEFKGSRICTKCFHEMLQDQFTDKNRNVPSIPEHNGSDIYDLDSPRTKTKKVLVTIVEQHDDTSLIQEHSDDAPSAESKTRSSSGLDSLPSHHQRLSKQTKIAEFYLDPASLGKAATYLRSASEHSISHHLHDDNHNDNSDDDDHHITVIASKSMKAVLESQRLSIESSTSNISSISQEIMRESDGSGSIPGPPLCPPPTDDWDEDEEEGVAVVIPSPPTMPHHHIQVSSSYSSSPGIPSPLLTASYLASPASLAPKERLFKFLRQGESYKAQSVIDYGVEIPTKEEISDVLHYCLDHIDKLACAMDTFVVLIESCGADVNAVDEDGVSPLMKLVRMNQPAIGSYFIFFRGADALQVHHTGECPLSVNLAHNETWVLTDFQYNQEDVLFSSGDFARIRRYIACLVTAGYAELVEKYLDSEKASIDEDEANYLYEECRMKDVKSLKEPRRIFELLHDLGAPRYVPY